MRKLTLAQKRFNSHAASVQENQQDNINYMVMQGIVYAVVALAGIIYISIFN